MCSVGLWSSTCGTDCSATRNAGLQKTSADALRSARDGENVLSPGLLTTKPHSSSSTASHVDHEILDGPRQQNNLRSSIQLQCSQMKKSFFFVFVWLARTISTGHFSNVAIPTCLSDLKARNVSCRTDRYVNVYRLKPVYKNTAAVFGRANNNCSVT